MKYPQRSPYLKFRRVGEDEYEIENWLYDEHYTTNRRAALFIRQLDGKHNPFESSQSFHTDDNREKKQLLSYLEDCDLLADKRKVLRLGIGSFIYPIAYIYPNRKLRIVSGFFSMILLMIFLPMLALGVYCTLHCDFLVPSSVCYCRNF